MAKRRPKVDSTETLRDAIDRGATRDKVAASDPAAAPLGTDDEAAGTPPDRARVELAAAHELTSREPAAPAYGRPLTVVVLLTILVAAVVGVLFLMR